MKRKKTISQLKKLADNVFSKWIRNRDRRCVTCGSTKNLKCGHFKSRAFNLTRYRENNCHAQCVACNIFRNGNMPLYAEFLERKYGQGIIQELNSVARVLHQFKRHELEYIIKKYDLQTKD